MLINIKDFDNYVKYYPINEGLKDGSQSKCNQIFAKGPTIKFTDGQSVEPSAIVKVVEDAIVYLAEEFQTTFRFAQRINIIFLRYSSRIKTMAVDENMNMYINASFVYHTLQMNKELVAIVIMHEVLHVLFNHIERGKNWLAANGKPLNKSTNHDTNLAADIEVNQTLVRLRLTSANVISNVIHGLYLTGKKGDLGVNTNVVPMETILNNEEYMNWLRSMSPESLDPDDEDKNKKITTSKDWDEGYKDAWNKLAEIIKKYGYKKVWDILLEKGIINTEGEIDVEKSPANIKSLEFLQVKSMRDFIFESKVDPQPFASIKPFEKGQTYEDGYGTALSKIVSQLKAAIDGGADGGEGGNGGKKYESGLKKDELEKIKIPMPESDGGKSGDDGIPSNFDSEKNTSYGEGGDGKDDDEITDDDLNKLEKDLEDTFNGNDENDKSNDSDKNNEHIDSGSIGGTGSYSDSKTISNDVLKDAGYSDDDIKEINAIREKNRVRNSKEGIEKAKIELSKNLRNSSIIKQYLDAIEVESEKYKNIWKEVMEDFLAEKTRRAGRDIKGGANDWKKKSRIAMGEYGVHRKLLSQDPQDVNVYVDVSGSVDVKLLEIISKSLVIFSQQYEYSGINICPWASTNNGIHRVDEFDKRSENEVTDEILKIVSKGIAQCGGGTEAKAVLAAMIDVVVNNLNDDNKNEKDDVHVVITDGYFDFENIENKLTSSLNNAIEDRDDVAERCPENTFWMIYDADESLMESWRNEIKKGKLIFINSDVVKNNA